MLDCLNITSHLTFPHLLQHAMSCVEKRANTVSGRELNLVVTEALVCMALFCDNLECSYNVKHFHSSGQNGSISPHDVLIFIMIFISVYLVYSGVLKDIMILPSLITEVSILMSIQLHVLLYITNSASRKDIALSSLNVQHNQQVEKAGPVHKQMRSL